MTAVKPVYLMTEDEFQAQKAAEHAARVAEQRAAVMAMSDRDFKEATRKMIADADRDRLRRAYGPK